MEIKSENSIDRIRGVEINPRQTERVAAGVRFAFRATVKVLDQDGDLVAELLKLIFDTSNRQGIDHKHESALEKRRGTTFGVRLAGSGQAAGS